MLREPLPLRTLADARDVLGSPESLQSPVDYEGLERALLQVWSRGYGGTHSVILKATLDYPARYGPPLVADIRKYGDLWAKKVQESLRQRPAYVCHVRAPTHVVEDRSRLSV